MKTISLGRAKRNSAIVILSSLALLMVMVPRSFASAGPEMSVLRPASALRAGMNERTYQLMRAQIPLDQAAQRIRDSAAGTRAGRSGFVQVRVSAERRALTVYWHGHVPAAMRHLFSALRSHVRLAVRPARYSLAELNAAVSQVFRSHRGTVESAGPLTDGSGIQVGVAGHAPALSPRTARKLFRTTVPVTVYSAHPAQLLTCQPNQADNAGPGSRCDDLPPNFWGGAVISVFANGFINSFCSTGFGVHFSNGSTGILTAGHCVRGPDAPSGSSWWNGQATTELGGTASSPYIASATTASHDSGVIVTPQGSGHQYYDGSSIFSGDTHNTKTVAGQQAANPGDWVCESGSFGGVLCNVHVQSTGQTKLFDNNTHKISGLAIASGANSGQPTGGDSGGPVFSLASGAGRVTAKGTVTGTDGTSVYFTPMQVISADLGVSVNTG